MVKNRAYCFLFLGSFLAPFHSECGGVYLCKFSRFEWKRRKTKNNQIATTTAMATAATKPASSKDLFIHMYTTVLPSSSFSRLH